MTKLLGDAGFDKMLLQMRLGCLIVEEMRILLAKCILQSKGAVCNFLLALHRLSQPFV